MQLKGAAPLKSIDVSLSFKFFFNIYVYFYLFSKVKTVFFIIPFVKFITLCYLHHCIFCVDNTKKL